MALRQFIVPVALLMIGVLTLTMVLVGLSASSQNRLSLRAARHLAGSALRVESDRIAGFVRDYAFWNDAAENLVVNLDEEWAAANVGAWASSNLGMTASLVIDGDGQVLYGSAEGVRQGSGFASRFSDDLAALTRAARQGSGAPRVAPETPTSYLLLDGEIAIAGAAAVKWEDDRPAPERGGGDVVLVFVRTIDTAMLERFGRLFLLPEMHLAPVTGTAPDSVPLVGIAGTPLGRLAWIGKRPGTALLEMMMVPLGGIVVLATGLLALISHRAHRASADLASSHRETSAQAQALQKSTSALRTALEEAARANAAKSDFLARMSHELRTPLNAILGFSELITIQLHGPDAGERYREYAQLIHDSGSHLRSLINDILDLSKIEAGRFDLQEEDVELEPIVEQCIGLLAPKAGTKGLSLSYRTVPARLRVDPRAIKQVLLNLLSNAVKFTPTGGEVSVVLTDGADGTVIAVRDTGRGMSAEDIEQAFQMFGRASVAHDGEGSGLGLNIARRLVELHGGALTVTSEKGVGTTVTVQIPTGRRLPPLRLADTA